jgi:hypothetical protein
VTKGFDKPGALGASNKHRAWAIQIILHPRLTQGPSPKVLHEGPEGRLAGNLFWACDVASGNL